MNKYIILTILIIALISLLTVADLTTDPTGISEEENGHLGLISNIEKTDNGFLFDLTDVEGDTIRCFFDEGVEKTDRLQILTGRFSEDNEIFFVNTIHEY